MKDFQEKLQSHVQGTTAKEISTMFNGTAKKAGKLIGAGVGTGVAATVKAMKNRHHKPRDEKPNSQGVRSDKLGKQMSDKANELGGTLVSVITLPVKSAMLTVELIKLTNEYVKAKEDELFNEIKSKLGEARDWTAKTMDSFSSKVNSIKNFLFHRSKGNVDIKEEVSGNRIEQARKFIDLLKTPQGEKAPHDFYNVDIKSAGVSLLSVKDGMMVANEVAAQMNSEIIEELLSENIIPAVLNPNLSDIPQESLTGRVLSEQQLEVVNNDLVGEELTGIETVNSEAAAIEQADPTALRLKQLENLVKLHGLGANRNQELYLMGDRGEVFVKPESNGIGTGQKYTVFSSDSSFSFITDSDGNVTTYDNNIEEFDDLLQSADVGFNPQAGSNFKPVPMKSCIKEFNAFNDLSAELGNLPNSRSSIAIGDRTFEIVKTADATAISTGKDSQLTINADGKIASTGNALNDLFAEGSKSNSAKLVARMRDLNNRVKHEMSIEVGAAEMGDTERAIGAGKQSRAESSQLQSAIGELHEAPVTAKPVEIPTTVSPQAVRETQESELVVAEAVKQERLTPKAVAMANLSADAPRKHHPETARITNPHLQELNESDLAQVKIEATEEVDREQAPQL